MKEPINKPKLSTQNKRSFSYHPLSSSSSFSLYNPSKNPFPTILTRPMTSRSDPDTPPTTPTSTTSLKKPLIKNSEKYGPQETGPEKSGSFNGFLTFKRRKSEKLLTNSSKALCVGARVGQEVEALKRVGVKDSIGLDLVPYPPNVIKGDFHYQPFDDETFDFEFSNVFDHALYPAKFVGEIQRTLKAGGVCVLHVALSRQSDKYSANDLYSVEPLKMLLMGRSLFGPEKLMGLGWILRWCLEKRKLEHIIIYSFWMNKISY